MQLLRTRLTASRASVARFWARCAALAAAALLVALLLPGGATAASPAPYNGSGDTRGGATPSYVGHPILAAVFVLGLGVVVAGATVVAVRLFRSE